jgi:sulfite exporter TauE/SafE
MKSNSNLKFLALTLLGSAILIGLLALKVTMLEGSSLSPVLPQTTGVINLWVIFITGLTVGGLTCLAVQGGLLASVIAAREEEEVKDHVNRKNPLFPTLAFLITKFVVYTAFGFLLGAFGGAIGISQTVQIIMQFIAGAYMIVIALNLLNVHPVFRYFIIQPPRFLAKKVRNQSKSKDIFAPAVLGAMTIFIPCGTTLAMEALAISSGSAPLGAAVMASFILGTTPLFFGVGWITSVLGDSFRTKFLKIAAIAIIYLGLASINGALTAVGFPVTLSSMVNSSGQKDAMTPVTQTAEITIKSNGYFPNYIKVKKNTPVTITLKSHDAFSCASAFRIPSLGIVKNLQPNETYTFTFTPDKVGQIPFSCSMGMYRGVIDVI